VVAPVTTPVAVVRRPPETIWRYPLAGAPDVVRPFAPPPQPWLPGHRGVDLGSRPGTPVTAAGAGTVSFAGVIAGRGVMTVTHAGGLRTTYEPVTSTVDAGTDVSAGDPIGVLAAGHAGCPRPACLHWGLRRGHEYLDPLALVMVPRVRLKPLG
jgi:murein DD-endopeptidase MepM/ murein hydrolase activator NlpD